jgi:hypothetical protein
LHGNDLRSLICHEVAHVYGIRDLDAVGNMGSRATCAGNPQIAPMIDDEQSLNIIYN